MKYMSEIIPALILLFPNTWFIYIITCHKRDQHIKWVSAKVSVAGLGFMLGHLVHVYQTQAFSCTGV